MRMLGLLRRASSGRDPCALIVSLVVHAARAHAERCRDRPVYGVSAEGLGSDFGDAAPDSELEEAQGSRGHSEISKADIDDNNNNNQNLL